MTASKESKPIRLMRLAYSILFGAIWYYSPFNTFRKVDFYTDSELINEFLNGKSITRFGDGELRIMENIPSNFFQDNDLKLSQLLQQVALSSNENIIKCLPRPLKSLRGLTIKAKLFWISNAFWNRKAWAKYVKTDTKYGDTQISRPYMDYTNKSDSYKRYGNLRRIWNDKKICLIEGEETRLGEGNDLFDNAKKIIRILAPSKNAFHEYNAILKKALAKDKDYIFLIALGPTATVLANDLSRSGRLAFDIGHIDVEYEWMRRGARKKEAISGKSVNEVTSGNTNRIINLFRRIKLRDLMSPIIFTLLLLPAGGFRLINKIQRRRLWLVTEGGDARDNGYHFYKYVREKHPEDMCYYAVRRNGAGYEKVAPLENIIRFGSLRHWLYYMAANLNISSQKSGNPCPIFWYLIHVKLGWFRNRVFLQHGITHNAAEWIKYDKTKFKYFVCGAEKEYDFVEKTFDYPEGGVLLTGFARWDALEDASGREIQKSILIMPTWRNWLGGETNSFSEVRYFKETDFFKYWNGLLNDDRFISYLEENDIIVYFYPHINMQKFLDDFRAKSESIKFVSTKEDIQEYLMKCDLMITDYSSVAFDFAYLEKPVIYYQFDQKEFRSRQYKEGYFNYEKDGFGPVVGKLNKLVSEIEKYFGGTMDKKYLVRAKEFFERRDNKNCERIYNCLRGKNNRVIHVIYSLARGGTETYMMRLIEQTQGDYENIVLYYDGENSWSDDLKRLGVKVIKLQNGKLKRLRDLRKIIQEEKADIVYSYTYFNSAWVMLAAFGAGVKKRIVHSHRIKTDGKTNGLKSIISKAIISLVATDKLACSETAGKSLFFGEKITVIQNGFDVEKYTYNEEKRAQIRQKYAISGNCMVLGMVGWINHNKNQRFAIEILKRSLSAGLDYKLLLIGKGDGKENVELKKLCKEEELTDKVIFAGMVDNPQDYYSAFDILLMPSRWEAFPYVALEAQANGLPIAVSTGVTEEAKINNNFRRLSLGEGAGKWAQVVCEMAGKRVEPNKRIKDYSIEKMAEEVRGIYEK